MLLLGSFRSAVELRSIPTHRDKAAMNGAPVNTGILPAPASKLAGNPIRCAQNDRQKTSNDRDSEPSAQNDALV